MKENADKFRALDGAELKRQLKDGADQLFRLRFQMSMCQMDGVKKARTLRKERARILTVLAEKAKKA
jgi:large subunit ribosomal protein L29